MVRRLPLKIIFFTVSLLFIFLLGLFLFGKVGLVLAACSGIYECGAVRTYCDDGTECITWRDCTDGSQCLRQECVIPGAIRNEIACGTVPDCTASCGGGCVYLETCAQVNFKTTVSLRTYD